MSKGHPLGAQGSGQLIHRWVLPRPILRCLPTRRLAATLLHAQAGAGQGVAQGLRVHRCRQGRDEVGHASRCQTVLLRMGAQQVGEQAREKAVASPHGIDHGQGLGFLGKPLGSTLPLLQQQ